MSDKIRVDGDYRNIVTDTGTYQEGEGYGRLIMIHTPDNRLVKAEIRVDKAPENSFAKGEIWVTATGWQPLVTIPASDWWKSVPGYLRWSNDNSDVATYRLAVRIFEAVLALPV